MIGIDLSGKHAAVCGSTQGIGWAAASLMAKAGARVTLIARNEDKLRNRVSELAGEGHSYLVCDMSDMNSVENAAKKLKDLSIDLLVNNTGGPPGGAAIDAEPAAFFEAFQQHLIANQLITQAVVTHMKAQNSGRIVNVISTSVKQPIKGLGVSNTIRGAVANWSKTLSMELGPNQITVNNVLPGATATERLTSIIAAKSEKTGAEKIVVSKGMQSAVPLNRFAEPEEIGNAILFLVSDLASYISGTNVVVDGGRTSCL